MPTRAFLLLLLIAGTGCPSLDPGEDPTPADDDDSAPPTPWRGQHLDGTSLAGHAVSLAGVSTVTDEQGWWELPAPAETPAQLDVEMHDGLTRSWARCSAPTEPTGGLYTHPGADALAELTLDVLGWDGRGEVTARILVSNPDDPLRRRTSAPIMLNAGLSSTSPRPVAPGLRWWIYVAVREGEGLRQWVIEEQPAALDAEQIHVSIQLPAAPLPTWVWDGAVADDVTEVRIVQDIDIGDDTPFVVTLWSGPPPRLTPVELTRVPETETVRFHTHHTPTAECAGPRIGSASVSVDGVVSAPAPQPLPRVTGEWAPRPDLELELPDGVSSVFLRAFLDTTRSWSLSSTEGCLPTRARWPESLAPFTAGEAVTADLVVEFPDGSWSRCLKGFTSEE